MSPDDRQVTDAVTGFLAVIEPLTRTSATGADIESQAAMVIEAMQTAPYETLALLHNLAREARVRKHNTLVGGTDAG